MTTEVTPFLYRHRGHSAAEWQTTYGTLVPEAREICIEIDTNLFKIGNGTTNYVSLPYANGLGIHKGTTPPADHDQLWINTTGLP